MAHPTMDHLKSALLFVAYIALVVLCVKYPPLLGLLIFGGIILFSIWSFLDRRAKEKRHPLPDQLFPPPPPAPPSICPARQWRSYEDAYNDLTALRQEIVDSGFPEIAGEKGLLREELLRELSHVRPITCGEWLGYVNFRLRDGTDHTQVPIYLKRILHVINSGYSPPQPKGPVVIH